MLSSPNLAALEHDTFQAFSLMILHYIQTNHRLFKAVLGRKAGGVKLEEIRRMLTDHFREILAGINQAGLTDDQLAMTIEYGVNAFMAMVIWWIEEDMPFNVEECSDLIVSLIEPGLYRVLAIE